MKGAVSAMEAREKERDKELTRLRSRDEKFKGLIERFALIGKRDEKFESLIRRVGLLEESSGQGEVEAGRKVEGSTVTEAEEEAKVVSWVLRGCAMICAMTSGSLAVIGFITKSERMAWTSLMFHPFSVVCGDLVCLANVRNLSRWHEKVTYGICAVFMGGLPMLFEGLTWIGQENEFTSDFMSGLARVFLASGAGLICIFPLTMYETASKWNKHHSNRELNKSVLNLHKSSLKVMGTVLYLSTASLRCTWTGVNGDTPVEERCANVRACELRSDELAVATDLPLLHLTSNATSS